jgi:glycosyltransferase involved in cell wall biosynthesis
MRICLFHPTLLPPRDYGGVERVVLWLAAGLQERGHEVFVAALAGSRLPSGVQLISVPADRTSAWDLLPLLPPGIDVVHFMAPPETGVFEKLPCAGLLTVHGNGKPGEVFPLNTVFLSADHAHRHGAKAYVHNGIDPREYHYDPRVAKADGLLFLSKTSWRVKNLAGAMKLSSQAGVKLTIAGGGRPWGRRIQATLSSRMQWAGAVSGNEKARLLSAARALIFPVLWSEPFGLVVVEAMISGTPVIASRCGSLPELVTPEVGALLDPPTTPESIQSWVEVMQSAVTQRSPWQPEACRQRAMTEFHYLKMAEGYENAYKKVIQGEALA